jgi:hypothetical protein
VTLQLKIRDLSAARQQAVVPSPHSIGSRVLKMAVVLLISWHILVQIIWHTRSFLAVPADPGKRLMLHIASEYAFPKPFHTRFATGAPNMKLRSVPDNARSNSSGCRRSRPARRVLRLILGLVTFAHPSSFPVFTVTRMKTIRICHHLKFSSFCAAFFYRQRRSPAFVTEVWQRTLAPPLPLYPAVP